MIKILQLTPVHYSLLLFLVAGKHQLLPDIMVLTTAYKKLRTEIYIDVEIHGQHVLLR